MAAVLAMAGCAADTTEPSDLGVTCTGKCDGLDSIKSLYRDVRELDLTDLSARGTNLATDELNDVLGTSFVGVELLEPAVFGDAALAENEELVEDIDALSTGLLAQFGEGELSADVNAVRARHLSSSGDDVFVESGFRISGGLDHGFSIDGDGIAEDVSVRLGLGSGAIEGRVIHATERDPGTGPEAVLEGVRAARGFVVPRSLEDVRDMRPGEAMALSAEGSFGINAGAGVPIVVADPGAITYSLVLSAALRAQIEGQMDVQLVRLEGDEVVVDVGAERGAVRSARLALRDGWGVQGLVESNVELGGFDVDLGRLLDRALRSQLNRRINLVSAELERTGRASRISVVRLRFSLDANTPELEDALTQALRGDVRLAQALSSQGADGVRVDYDLLRSGLSASSHAGLELFGMRFFNTTLREEGQVRIQTPGGAQELMFDTLHREGGWFFESHGHGRVALAGIRIDEARAVTRSEVNLFVEVLEGDEFMQRDTLLDQLDSLIVALAGSSALAAIEEHGNALQRHVETTCNPSPAFDPCREDVLMSTEVMGFRADGRAALEAATSDLEPSLQRVVLAAGDLRLASQATVEPAASFVGPSTSIVLDYRLDDASLERILVDTRGDDFRNALLAVLAATRVDREDTPVEIDETREGLGARNQDALDSMVTMFTEGADTYERMLAVERARIDGLGAIGGSAVAVDVPVEGSAVDYDAATARTVVQARSQAVRDLFDELLEEADRLNNVRPEIALGFALLAMQRADAADVRMNLDMDLSDGFAQDYTHYRSAGQMGFDVHGRGSAGQLIGGGVFDVDALIDVP